MNDARLGFAWLAAGGALVLCLPVGVGCGGASASASGGATAASEHRVETLEHEDCSLSGNRVEALDTNGDGKPDISRVFDKGSGKELCRICDLNHDGKPDLYEYFDSSGTVRRREFCYDDTGVVNAIEHYEGGKLVSREFDADGQHRIDTWDFFDPNAAPDPKTGRPAHPARRERDTTGDGRVDQWWTWNGDKVTIAVDSTGDGKPDPESTLVLGGSSDSANDATGASASSSPPAASASASPPAASAGTIDGGKP